MVAGELPEDLNWVNSHAQPTLNALRGNVVILHFFTSSCLHCLASLTALKLLAQRHDETVAVLSIHCPKYPREFDNAALQKAVNRAHIRHPVAQDRGFAVWHQFNIAAWPSAVVLDPQGNVLERAQGLRQIQALDETIEEYISKANPNLFRPTEYPEWSQAGREPKMTLQFPMGVAVTDEHLYVADSGHNRIIEATHSGRILRTFGSGAPGLWDGTGRESGFDSPGAIVVNGGHIYVADVGNHVLRRLNLLSGEVITIAGTGKNGFAVPQTPAEATSVPLNYPLGMAISGDTLFFSAAGNNQIWQLDLSDHTVELLAGNGLPQMHNATGGSASFNSPRGLTLAGETLLVADSQNGAVRAVNCQSRHVSRLAGTGPFKSGDEDGDFVRARFQLPTAVATDPTKGAVFVADTFNNAIRRMDVKARKISTVKFDYRLHQPQALAIHEGNLWIANTNAHELVKLDPETGDFECVDLIELEV